MVDRIGVDFGTSHTVAVIGTTPLLFDSSPLLPSAVFADATGRLLTGRDAYRSGQLDPGRWEPNPKRRIDDGTLLLGVREVTVREAVAAVLGRVGEEAKRTLGGAPAETVLTHPAGWAATRRAVLTDAAAAAGFGRVTLVPEPVAAAAYFTTVSGHRVPSGSAVVVYDLGAGTFDVSVLRRTAGGWEVVATDGLPDVGGLDLDAAVVEFVGRTSAPDPALWARLVAPGTTADQRHRRLLWEDARAVKEQLSREASATLVVPVLDRDVLVTRAEFEELARPWLDRTVNLTTATMFRSGVTDDRLAGLFLVGGSSRIPLVATMLHRALGVAPVVLEQPELVVAQGSLAVAAPDPAVGSVPHREPARRREPEPGPEPDSGPDPAPPAGHASARPARTRPAGPFVPAAALVGILGLTDPVRPALLIGAGTVFRPATVLPFLATVLLVAGARRTLPVGPAASVWFGAVAGLAAVTAHIAPALVFEVAHPDYTFAGWLRAELGSYAVTSVGIGAIAVGLGLVFTRGMRNPERFGWRALVYAVLVGIVPGTSGFTAVQWWPLVRHGIQPPWSLRPTLAQAEVLPTAPVLFGLAVGWMLAMTAAALLGRALGGLARRGATSGASAGNGSADNVWAVHGSVWWHRAGAVWWHRAGAVVLAVAGGVLARFMADERQDAIFDTGPMDLGVGWIGPVTRLWRATVDVLHPAVFTGLLLVAAAAAYAVVRAQSQTRSGGS